MEMLAQLSPTTVLKSGRYSELLPIKQGNFGITYQAFDRIANEKVAIREIFINSYCQRDKNGVTVVAKAEHNADFTITKGKFIDEAEALRQINHPSMVKVTDIFQENGTAYMVMRYIYGISLKDYVEKSGKLKEDIAISLVGKISEAVILLHNKNYIHRNISPVNIFITPQGTPVLLNFGVTREFSRLQTLTYTDKVDAGYAPIEQYTASIPHSFATDVYSLGAVLYYLLTECRPVVAANRVDVPLASPQTFNKEISSGTDDAIMKAMSLHQKDRFQSVDDFLVALKYVRESHYEMNFFDKLLEKLF
jgi:serine/threonine protein kinase